MSTNGLNNTQRVRQESEEHERVPPLNPTRLKMAGFVLGLLLLASAVTCYYLHTNAIAVYVTGAVGGAFIVGIAIWSVIDCIKQSQENAYNLEIQRMREERRWLEYAWEGNTAEIRSGVDEGRVTADLNTMLNCAAEKGHVETVKLLIEKGVDPTEQKDDSYTALHKAIIAFNRDGFNQAFEIVQILVEKFPKLINRPGRPLEGASLLLPLHLACMCCSGQRSLRTKTQHTDAELIQFLLNNEADIHTPDEEGNTPLHIAARGCGVAWAFPPDIDVIKALVKANVNLNTRNKAGMTAVQVAQKKHPKWFEQNQKFSNEFGKNQQFFSSPIT